MWDVPLFNLNYNAEEENAVLKVLRSKWLSSGPRTLEFEQKFSEFLGNGIHCCALSSCTAALHIALLAAGVKPGDEVILPGLTFIADLNVIHNVGAVPVVADSNSLTDWNISPADIACKITKKTKALIIVHYAGYPCDMEEILSLSRRNNLVLIEDVAHAVGAVYRGRQCGTFGDIACFSFFSNKNLAVGEGGMFVSGNRAYDKRARLFRSHGMTSMTVDRHYGKTISYDVLQPGFNYRMDEIRAALGIVQLEKLGNGNIKRGRVVQKYLERLSGVEEITIPWPKPPADRISAYHIFPILLPRETDRTWFMTFMKEKGIQTSIHYPALKDFTYYKNRITNALKVVGEIADRVVTLPLFPDMNKKDVLQVASAVSEFFNSSERNK